MKIARQFLTYCLVGLLNTGVGLAVILALSVGLGWHYIAANAGGYICGVAVSFLLNRAITFRGTALQGRATRQAGSFFVVLGSAYGVQLAALYGMVECWRVPELPAQAAAILIYTAIGFLGSRFLVFATRPPVPKT